MPHCSCCPINTLEPVNITINTKAAPVIMASLEIPTKGANGSLGAASKAASFKKKKETKKKDAFVPPAAYLEVLGVQDGNLPPQSGRCLVRYYLLTYLLSR